MCREPKDSRVSPYIFRACLEEEAAETQLREGALGFQDPKSRDPSSRTRRITPFPRHSPPSPTNPPSHRFPFRTRCNVRRNQTRVGIGNIVLTDIAVIGRGPTCSPDPLLFKCLGTPGHRGPIATITRSRTGLEYNSTCTPFSVPQFLLTHAMRKQQLI